jgi:small conductance mechanosensitive channel
MNKAKIDKALKKFIESIISAVLKVLLILTAAGMLGVETTSFIAILGAAGLAIGMALSGTLQNFAG